MFGQNIGTVIPILTMTIVRQVATGIGITIDITTIGKKCITQCPMGRWEAYQVS
jgi:hypothetical protein